MTPETLLVIAPELLLSAAALAIYLGGLWVSKPLLWRWIALAAIFGSFLLWSIGPEKVSHLAQREVVSDSIGEYFRALLLGAVFLLVLCQWEPIPLRGDGEYLATLLLGATGAMLATSAKNLVLLFVGLELLSLSTYVLLSIGRGDRLGREAVLKYFFLSVFSSAMLLYGLSFFYGIGGSTDWDIIATRLRTGLSPGSGAALLATLALVFTGMGLAFKAAAAPFHFYAPEVYCGTTFANAAFLSVLPKIASLVVFLRLSGLVFPATFDPGWGLLAILAAASMVVGNLGALLQQDLRRLLAYSSIAHAGYMLLGVAAYAAGRAGRVGAPVVSFDGAAAFGFYLLAYSLATLGVFAGILALRKDGREVRDIEHLFGGGWANDLQTRLVAWAMVICLVSLAGVPPLAGFWGKLFVFGSALSIPPAQADAFGIFVGLTVLAAINTAVGAAYYLRVVAALIFASPSKDIQPNRAAGPHVAAWACAIVTIGIGLWWQPWVHWSYGASPLAPTLKAVAGGLSSENFKPNSLNSNRYSHLSNRQSTPGVDPKETFLGSDRRWTPGTTTSARPAAAFPTAFLAEVHWECAGEERSGNSPDRCEQISVPVGDPLQAWNCPEVARLGRLQGKYLP